MNKRLNNTNIASIYFILSKCQQLRNCLYLSIIHFSLTPIRKILLLSPYFEETPPQCATYPWTHNQDLKSGGLAQNPSHCMILSKLRSQGKFILLSAASKGMKRVN